MSSVCDGVAGKEKNLLKDDDANWNTLAIM